MRGHPRTAHAATTSNDGPFAGRDPSTLTLAGGMLRGPDGTSQNLQEALARVTGGALEVYAENLPKGLPPESIGKR